MRRWATADEEAAWRAWRRLMVSVEAAIADDLAGTGLSPADYEVLSTLVEQPDHTSRLGRQAQKMGWSRSRLSSHSARMEARGLVRRQADPDDGRGCLLVLTDGGIDALRSASPSHLATVRRAFLDHASKGELEAIRRLARKAAPAPE